MARVVWTPTADSSLDGIFDYIARKEGRPSVAAKILRKIDQRCRLAADFPGMGTPRDDFGPGIRCLAESSFVIIYRPLDETAGVEVLLLAHGHRDLPSLVRDLLQ